MVAFVVVKLKILNVFVLIQHHRVFLPLIQSTPTPLQKKKKENYLILQKISQNVELK